jgi:hypothetical protein
MFAKIAVRRKRLSMRNPFKREVTGMSFSAVLISSDRTGLKRVLLPSKRSGLKRRRKTRGRWQGPVLKVKATSVPVFFTASQSDCASAQSGWDNKRQVFLIASPFRKRGIGKFPPIAYLLVFHVAVS